MPVFEISYLLLWVVGVSVTIWHQHWTTSKLIADMRADSRKLRASIDKLRAELRGEHSELLADNAREPPQGTELN